MEAAKDTKIVADSVDDNIFQWNVKIANFSKDSLLHQDCVQLLKQFKYDYIELQIGSFIV